MMYLAAVIFQGTQVNLESLGFTENQNFPVVGDKTTTLDY
jgi:hypothetical protein